MQLSSGASGTLLQVQVCPCPSLRKAASLEHTISSAVLEKRPLVVSVVAAWAPTRVGAESWLDH